MYCVRIVKLVVKKEKLFTIRKITNKFLIKVEKNIYLHGSVSISEPITSEQLKFDYLGLNKLMKTYNTISDIENHQTPDKDLNFLNELIKSKNNGYFPDDIF